MRSIARKSRVPPRSQVLDPRARLQRPYVRGVVGLVCSSGPPLFEEDEIPNVLGLVEVGSHRAVKVRKVDFALTARGAAQDPRTVLIARQEHSPLGVDVEQA